MEINLFAIVEMASWLPLSLEQALGKRPSLRKY